MHLLLYLYIIFAIILLYISIKAFQKNKFMLFLFSIFTVFYILIRNILLLSGNYINFAILNPYIDSFNKEAVLYVFIYVVINYTIFYIFYKYFNKNIVVKVKQYNKKRDVSKIIILSIIIILFFIGPVVGMGYLVYLFIYNILKNHKNKLLIILSFFLLLYFYTFTDDRRNWLALILAILFVIFVKKRHKNIFKILMSGFVSLVILSYILVAFRTDGLFDYSAVYKRITNNSNALMSIFEIEADFPIVSDDVVLLFDKVLVEKKVDYTYGVNFAKPLYAIIPRDIWEEKPISISRLFAKKFNPDFYAQGGSEPITIYGELFWNFGYLSFLFFILFAYLAVIADKKIEQALICKNDSDLALYITLIALSFIVLRGPIDNFWLMYMYIFVLIYIERAIPNFLFRKKK